MARYAFILPVRHNGPIPQWMERRQHRRLCAIAAVVKARTEARVWIDVVRREAMFGYINPDTHTRRLAMGFPLYRADGSVSMFDPILDKVGVEQIVWLLQVAKVDPKIKAQWKRTWEERRAHAEYERMSKEWESNGARDAERDLDRVYDRHVMGSHFRGSVLVNGLRPGKADG